jgi:hypothetical protein
MKKSILPAVIAYILIFTALSAQNNSIKELHFPYQNGYKFSMTDSSITYDQYNFPQSQAVQETQYTVTDHPSKKGVLIFKLDVYDKSTDQLAITAFSYLTVGKKGMSWWIEKSKEEKGKITNAIKLPLSKGSTWKSIFKDQSATMTCITTDTTLNTMYGNITCFGVSYDVTLQETKEYKYYTLVKEFYNVYAGKVHTEQATYLLLKETNKQTLASRSWGNITYSNLTEEQIKLIR